MWNIMIDIWAVSQLGKRLYRRELYIVAHSFKHRVWLKIMSPAQDGSICICDTSGTGLFYSERRWWCSRLIQQGVDVGI